MTEIAWRPDIIRFGGGGSSLLDELARSVPGIEVFDTIDVQLRDLIKTRNPAVRMRPEELDRAVEVHLAGRDRRSYGVWVYYPWSRRLVHLLDELEFTELRTDRNRNKITAAEQQELGRKRIGVVGLSVGQATAMALALERAFGEIRLADFDCLDLSNLNRLRTGVHNLGVAKVYQTARDIAGIDPFLRVLCFPDGLCGGDYDAFLTGGGKLDVLIEECDSIDVKVRVRQQARRHGIPVVMDTGDRGMLDIERFDLEPDRPIFHGLIGDIDPARLAGLTTEEKIPYVLKIIGKDTMSERLRASLLEVEASLSSWPQLASSVHLGAALAADASRRILLGGCRVSGRFHADLNAIVPDGLPPPATEPREAPPAVLTAAQMKRMAARVAAPRTLAQVDVERLVSDAILAPSGGNCQPWRFYWDGRLHLFLDRARAHSLLDYNYFGGIAALGAVWENLQLSALQQGLELRARTFPLGEDSELAAAFTLQLLSKAAARRGQADSLYESVGLRHTNRKLEGRQPLFDGELEQLSASARSLGGEIRWLSDSAELARIGELLGEGDRLRFLHREMHRQLMSELRFSADEALRTGDGISVGTLELSAADRVGLELSRSWEAMSLVKTWEAGDNLGKMARKQVAAAAAVGLLLMPKVRPLHFLRGGRAAQRVWLTATRLGIAFHPMTALPYLFTRLNHGSGLGLDSSLVKALTGLRQQYTRLFAIAGQPAEVMLFRVAIADAPAEKSVRRPVADCLFKSGSVHSARPGGAAATRRKR